MTSSQLAIVQRTWAELAPQAELLVNVFHAELFRLDPSLFEIFEPRLAAQRRILAPGLTILVEYLDDPDALAAAARQVGRLQSAQDLQLAHPADLREAFLRALRAQLGSVYSVEIAQAWTLACARFGQALRGAPVTEPC